MHNQSAADTSLDLHALREVYFASQMALRTMKHSNVKTSPNGFQSRIECFTLEQWMVESTHEKYAFSNTVAETVRIYENNQLAWQMRCFGILAETHRAFLERALHHQHSLKLFNGGRGPGMYRETGGGAVLYINTSYAMEFESFYGEEVIITNDSLPVSNIRYHGGLMR